MTLVNPEIDIICQAGQWPDTAEISSLVTNALSATIDIAGLKMLPGAELSLVLSDDEHVKILNKSWREIDKPTNVLSFPVKDVAIGELPDLLLGDVVLSMETITREAIELGISFNDHLTHLVIHGFLHIFGYDHTDDILANEMEAIEIACLAKIGIGNPYTDLNA